MNSERNNWKLTFNPNLYYSRVSSFGAKLIDNLVSIWDENESKRKCQQATQKFNPRGYNRHYANNAENINLYHEYNDDSELHMYVTSKPPQNNIINTAVTAVPNFEDILGTNAAINNNANTSTSHRHANNVENIMFYNEYNDDSELRKYSKNKHSHNLIFNTDLPKVGDMLGTNAANNSNANIPNQAKYKKPETEEEDEFIPPTIQNILCPPLPKIKKEVKRKEEHVGWDNMFDSEALFANTSSIKGRIKKETKPNASKESSGSSSVKIEKSKLPHVVEICHDSVPKRNYKQLTITELVPKKKKKVTNNTNPANRTNSFRKKTYTTAIKDWLENVESENSIDEISATINIDRSVLDTDDNNDAKAKINEHHSVQSRLVNRDGILKFTSTVDANKFIIHGKQSNIENTSTISPKEVTQPVNIIHVKQIQTPGISSTNHNENDQHDSFSSGSTNAGRTNDYLQIVGAILEKTKKRKQKFIAPIKSQIPVKDVTFNIIKLSIDNVGEHYAKILQENGNIILTLTFQNGFSQLNRQHTEDDCHPSGIMICSLTSHTFYHLKKSTIQQSDSLREFLRNIMKPEITKICYEAKEIIIFVAACLDLHPSVVASGIVDVKVACFLLDPDRPPQTFSEVQNAISYTPEYTIATENNMEKTAWYMTVLNESAVTIQQLLKENSLWDIFTGMEMRLLPILAGLEIRGLQVDMARLDSMKDTILERMKQVEQECYKSVGKVFQINSPRQLRAILYDDLALDTKGNVKIKETVCSGAKSTSETMLKSLADVHPLPQLVLKYRHLHKALATFITGIAQHVHDGVVRATWLQTAAATGRIACNNPNLQAIPKLPFDLTLYSKLEEEQKHLQLRSMYVARQGYVFLGADFQHVECRVFAHLARDTALLELFTRSGDFFVALAAKWMNKRQEEISQEDRDRTKRIVYASMYGAGTRKLMDILNMSYDETLTVVLSFNRTFPSLKAFGQRVVEHCRQNDRILETLCGRRRKFQNINSPDFQLKSQAERQAVNFIIQGSAADLCKAAMISTENCLSELTPAVECHLVLQIHDELVWEVAEPHLERVRECVKAAMESCGALCGLNVPLPVSVCSGKSWADMH